MSLLKNPSVLSFCLVLFIVGCKKNDKKKNQPIATNVQYTTTISTAINGGPDTLNCGGFVWKVKFTLDSITPNGGYFVQRININKTITANCPGNRANMALVYYEAWRVNPGQRVTTYLQNNPNDYDDMYSFPPQPNSVGSSNYLGDLRYYDNVVLPPNMIANNPNTYAGILRSDTIPPPFWGNEAGLAHNASSNWDCCNEHNDTQVAFVPNPNTNPNTLQKSTSQSENNFIAKVNRLKSWVDVPFTQKDLKGYLDLALELENKDNLKISHDYKTFLEQPGLKLNDLAKLFILTRVLYNINETYPIENSKSFGGWVKPLKSKTYNLLWPLIDEKENKRLDILSQFNGYLGPKYDAIGELKYINKLFERRPL